MRVAALGLVLAAVACGGGGDAGSTSDSPAGGAPAGGGAGGPTGTGTIAGAVSFTGAAPANPTIDMAAEPKCATKHTGTIRDPEYVINNGKLGNVFVYVKSGLPAGATYTAPSTAVTLDQNGCLYRPRVFGVMVGQSVEITNSDSLLHNIKSVAKNQPTFNISQSRAGVRNTRTFSTPEVMVPLECSVHGWMNAFVGVVPHPFFAVSGEDGTFEIRNLPAGTYEVEAWHERLGTKTMTVTVADGGRGAADFSYAAP